MAVLPGVVRLWVTVLCTIVAVEPTPALAIEGGHAVSRVAYPSFAVVTDGCGGVLVAPSRVLTSANCINAHLVQRGDRLHVGSVRRRVDGIANHPRWVRQEFTRTDFCRLRRDCRFEGNFVGIYCVTELPCADDLALIRLDRPVTGVTPARLTPARPGTRALVLGVGQKSVDDETGRAFRAAQLTVVADTACEPRYRRAWRRAFDPASMFCARSPLAAPRAAMCFGDEGGPIGRPTRRGWGLQGIASWDRDCGGSAWPSVFTEVWRARSFVRGRRPTWLPSMRGQPRITGTPSVGATLTCHPPPMSEVATKVLTTFFEDHDEQTVLQRGQSSRYVVRDRDSGLLLGCRVEARNAGGVGVASTVGEGGVQISAAAPPPRADTTSRRTSLELGDSPRLRWVLFVVVAGLIVLLSGITLRHRGIRS